MSPLALVLFLVILFALVAWVYASPRGASYVPQITIPFERPVLEVADVIDPGTTTSWQPSEIFDACDTVPFHALDDDACSDD